MLVTGPFKGLHLGVLFSMFYIFIKQKGSGDKNVSQIVLLQIKLEVDKTLNMFFLVLAEGKSFK